MTSLHLVHTAILIKCWTVNKLSKAEEKKQLNRISVEHHCYSATDDAIMRVLLWTTNERQHGVTGTGGRYSAHPSRCSSNEPNHITSMTLTDAVEFANSFLHLSHLPWELRYTMSPLASETCRVVTYHTTKSGYTIRTLLVSSHSFKSSTFYLWLLQISKHTILTWTGIADTFHGLLTSTSKACSKRKIWRCHILTQCRR